jgi:hypothetical protein
MRRRVLLGLTLALLGCSRKDSRADSAPPVPAPHVENSAPSPLPAVADGVAGKSFGAPCVTDGDCGGGVCFHKRIKGPDAGHERRDSGEALEHAGYCSILCNDDDDCPVPPTRGKCGARGMCKRPE